MMNFRWPAGCSGAVIALSLAACPLPATADPRHDGLNPEGGASPALLADSSAVFTEPAVPRPPYGAPMMDPTFHTLVRRIAGNVGTALGGGVAGSWGRDARHHYSKDQPWNSDGTLLALQNSGSPSQVYLDGRTYTVKLGKCSSYSVGDDRWHPSKAHPDERINVNGSELMWYDVVRCVKTRSWTLPFAVDYFGPSEGNPSNDGRYAALTDGTRMFVVDMDPQPPLAPYPAQRIGPAVSIASCGLADCSVDWVSVSASGKYVVVSYNGDHPRVFDLDPGTLALTPRVMPASETHCSGAPGRGYIYDLGHADLAVNPFDNNEDVLVGQEHCGNRGRVVGGKVMGSVVMVRLRDGAVTPLTDPTNEAYAHHISARNYDRPGWVYVGYHDEPGKKYSDEIVAVKLDGSKSVQRFAHKHSAYSGCYRCESHAVPSRDGRRVLFASNWDRSCGLGCGASSDIKAYVVWAPGAVAGVEDENLDRARLELERVYPNPAVSSLGISYSLGGWAPARLELVDVTGRQVLGRDLGSPGPGHHEARLGAGSSPPPGVYWLRLSQAGQSAATRVVFVR